jgi:hypothetical protein
MTFFSPCDNVDIRMFFSDAIMNKYPNSLLFELIERKKRSDVFVVNDSIVLEDVSYDILKLIQECMLYDFNINTIIVYLKSGDDKQYYKYSLQKFLDQDTINLNMTERSGIFLMKFEKSLKKYLNCVLFKYTYHETIMNVMCEPFDLSAFINYILTKRKIETHEPFIQYKKKFVIMWNTIMKSKFDLTITETPYGSNISSY